MSSDPSDFQKLVEDASQGSEAAARQVLDLYGDHVIRVVRKLLNPAMRAKFDSQDFAQAVWASVFARRADLRQFETPDAMIAFLATVTRNKVIEEFRRRFQTQKFQVRRELTLDDSTQGLQEAVQAQQPTASELAMAKEQWSRLTTGATDQQREILRLKMDGFTNVAIAEQLGLNERTVRRALKHIAAKWGSDEQ